MYAKVHWLIAIALTFAATAEAAPHIVSLACDAQVGVQFVWYRDNQKVAGPSLLPSQDDSTAMSGMTYIYTVRAYDPLTGRESGDSNAVSATIPADPPPPPPPIFTKYAVGDTFKVITGGGRLNVRQSPSTTSSILRTLQNGSLGTIKASPSIGGFWSIVPSGYVLDSLVRQ